MMQIVKKWQIIIYFDLSEKTVTFSIYDNFYNNMLKKLQDISWDLEPTKIEIKTQNQAGLGQVSHNQPMSNF